MRKKLILVSRGIHYVKLTCDTLPLTQFAVRDELACGAVHEGWTCTRRQGHEGFHMAHCDPDEHEGYTLESSWLQ